MALSHRQVHNCDEETALHCASSRGHIECVDSLLECADPPLDLQDKNGQTPLHLSLNRRHVDIARLLMSKGCRLDLQDSKGDTPLHIACRQGLLSAAQTLCHLGSAVDLVNKAGQSALHIAAREGHLEIVRVLCVSGADLNVQNKDGLTPEMLASAQEHTPVHTLLMRLKSDSDREQYIDQLCPLDAPLRRIKLKLFGHSGVGKSRLIHTMQTGMIGGILGGLSRRWSESSAKDSGGESSSESMKNQPIIVGNNNQLELAYRPAHTGYTRGIDVQAIQVPSAGEFSAWEFGGYEPYHQTYDHFVGNADCIHVIMFRAVEATELQYAQVLYWLNLLTSRVTPSEPIGHCGVSPRRSHLVIVATHVDQLHPAPNRASNGSISNSDADALLSTVRLRYAAHFDIHDQIIHVDTQNASCVGVKALRAYLALARTQVLSVSAGHKLRAPSFVTMTRRLPHTLGLLDSAIAHVQSLRKRQPFASLPVMNWPHFMQSCRQEVNPLASEAHCRQLMQQLQLIGEVIYLKDDQAQIDFVVLSADWLGQHIIGALLSAEYLSKAHITGTYCPEDFALFYPELVGEQLIQILDTLQICTLLDDVEYEFAAFNMLPTPSEVWPVDVENVLVYGGMRMQLARGYEAQWPPIFPRLQNALRRSMQDFQDPMDAELLQWRNCSKLLSGRMEAFVRLLPCGPHKDMTVELQVRGPKEDAASCFYFMEDMANLIEQTVSDVAPGLPVERHLLSAKDLKSHSKQPVVYSPDAVMNMQRKELINIESSQNTKELFTDVVCFGCTNVTAALTLGVDIPVAQLSLFARRELATLLDPSDSMGRDWSILAVRLSLQEQLPDVDSTGPQLSRTDQLLAEWALSTAGLGSARSVPSSQRATVGRLCDVLEELGRADAVAVLSRTVPLYLVATHASNSTATNHNTTLNGTTNSGINQSGTMIALDCADSGVASSAPSHSSQRTESNLSR